MTIRHEILATLRDSFYDTWGRPWSYDDVTLAELWQEACTAFPMARYERALALMRECDPDPAVGRIVSGGSQ